jgi:hypothetical protein
VFESRVLRKIFGPKRYEITGEWSCTVRNIIFYNPHQILLGRSLMWQERTVQGFDGKARRKEATWKTMA